MTTALYWSNKGKYQTLYERLHQLIPSEGECEESRGKNRALDKLRRASNCYYDVYNNGLCNRAAEFRRIFGFGGTTIVNSRFSGPDVARLDEAMDELIAAAAVEQGIAKYTLVIAEPS